MVASLFKPVNGRTLYGFYVVGPGVFILQDMQRKTRAAILRRGLDAFVVSASDSPQGVRYMFGFSDADESWLNFAGKGYRARLDAACAAAEITRT
jgi:hypothetical protein